MRAKTTLVVVSIGPMSKVPKLVWNWEIPVLEELYALEVVSEGEDDISKLPEVNSEFARMQDAYGSDEKTGVSHVENAYGRGKAGISELKKAIAKSAVNKKAAKTKVAKKAADSTVSKPEKTSFKDEGSEKGPLA